MFNAQARWDRKLPQDNDGPAGDPIEVLCLMREGRLTPRSFARNKRVFEITNINFTWEERRGKMNYLFFSVATPQGHYEIVFSPGTLRWRLNRLLVP